MLKLVKNSKWVLKIVKFGTQHNWCLPNAVGKSDFLFELSKLSKKANKISGCILKLRSYWDIIGSFKIMKFSDALMVYNELNV